MNLACKTIESPVGELRLFASDEGLVAILWENDNPRRVRLGEAGYGQLAQQLGNPRASRAVGAANGRNPVSIIVPCHRVIGSSGKLTGFAGGLDIKARLLGLEKSAEPGTT